MRIEKIKLKNYRQFKDIEFNFKKESENDLYIIIGKNGTCKTNMLNAINWCLYGDEPHFSKDSQQLPILNLKTIEESEDGKNYEILAEVYVKSEDNKNMTFLRKAIFKVYKDKQQPVLQSSEFELKVVDDKGNTQILGEEQANSFVERFVPKRIREFFFFDGERLDNYFKEATSQNISNAVLKISQIDLLDRMEDRLDKILKEFTRSAGKYSPEIEDARNRLELEEGELKTVGKNLDECNREIAIANERRREYEEKLRGLPDVVKLEQRREGLRKKYKAKEDLRDGRVREKQILLFEYGKIIPLYSAIEKNLQLISQKRENKQIPPTIDKSLLENIIRTNTCDICGRTLDTDSKKRVSNLISEITLSSDVVQQLLKIEAPLSLFKEKLNHFDKEIRKITNDIDVDTKELSDFEQEINQIDREISGYDSEKIKEWHEARLKFENIYIQEQQRLGSLRTQKKDLLGKIESLKKTLDIELSKEKKANKLKKQIDFIEKALIVVRKTKDIIMTRIREKIEVETKRLFFEFLWKKETFRDVKIGDDYNINLIHALGYECLGSTSAAERELLALSFTLALHNISGFASPILIDTPVARISDEHREKFGEIFSTVSSSKQIILLFTPAEYSDDISRWLDKKANTRYQVKLIENERETIADVL